MQEAVYIVAGQHRAPGHLTMQPIERAHVPVKDRVRPMRGLQAIATGQQLAEGLTVAQAIRRGRGGRPRGTAAGAACTRVASGGAAPGELSNGSTG